MPHDPKPAVRPLPLIAAMLATLLSVATAPAVTPAEADLAFNSLNKTFWDPAAQFFRKEESGPKKADFWFAAQLWETVMDRYDRTGTAGVKHRLAKSTTGS